MIGSMFTLDRSFVGHCGGSVRCVSVLHQHAELKKKITSLSYTIVSSCNFLCVLKSVMCVCQYDDTNAVHCAVTTKSSIGSPKWRDPDKTLFKYPTSTRICVHINIYIYIGDHF